MRHQVSFCLFAVVAALIIIQRDIDGDLLINGWHGLGLAVWACLAGMLWSGAGAARISFTREDV